MKVLKYSISHRLVSGAISSSSSTLCRSCTIFRRLVSLAISSSSSTLCRSYLLWLLSFFAFAFLSRSSSIALVLLALLILLVLLPRPSRPPPSPCLSLFSSLTLLIVLLDFDVRLIPCFSSSLVHHGCGQSRSYRTKDARSLTLYSERT